MLYEEDARWIVETTGRHKPGGLDWYLTVEGTDGRIARGQVEYTGPEDPHPTDGVEGVSILVEHSTGNAGEYFSYSEIKSIKLEVE